MDKPGSGEWREVSFVHIVIDNYYYICPPEANHDKHKG
jgi:hypothetical protein